MKIIVIFRLKLSGNVWICGCISGREAAIGIVFVFMNKALRRCILLVIHLAYTTLGVIRIVDRFASQAVDSLDDPGYTSFCIIAVPGFTLFILCTADCSVKKELVLDIPCQAMAVIGLLDCTPVSIFTGAISANPRCFSEGLKRNK